MFAHQFSSIAGAGPVTGPILASVFGWVPVLLWLLIGGLFFGAVQDFGAPSTTIAINTITKPFIVFSPFGDSLLNICKENGTGIKNLRPYIPLISI